MNHSLSPSYGPLSQTSFLFGTLSQKEKNLNADFTYPVNLGLFSPVTLAWGAEYRKETYGQTAGDVQSYGGGPYAIPNPLYTQTSPGVYALVGTAPTAPLPGGLHRGQGAWRERIRRHQPSRGGSGASGAGVSMAMSKPMSRAS